MDDHLLKIFLDVQSGLSRQGPGDDVSTLQALDFCDLPADPRVLDVGCGPGAQTMALAGAMPRATVPAIDLHDEYLQQLRAKISHAGCENRVHVQQADMHDLPFPNAAFDLIWAEGSAYIMGIPNALRSWRRLLRPGGYLALTQLVRLTDNPPPEVKSFFATEYPAMTDVPGILSEFAGTGYDVRHHFVLPDISWWQDYYTPLSAKLEALETKYADDPAALSIIAGTRTEIAIREQYPEAYGYVFFIARVV